jgi:hypothetical protein
LLGLWPGSVRSREQGVTGADGTARKHERKKNSVDGCPEKTEGKKKKKKRQKGDFFFFEKKKKK